MKKKLVAVLLFVIALPIILLTSCINECEEHLDFEIIDYKMPTCTEDGYIKAQCTICGAIVIETEPARHNYVNEVVIEEATCVKPGKKYGICSECKVENEYEYNDYDNHKYTEKNIVVEPTCTKWGKWNYKCELCDKVMPESDDRYMLYPEKSLGHDYHEGACTRCNAIEEYKIEYYINDTLYAHYYFTKDTYKDIEDPTNVYFKGVEFLGWESHSFNYEDIRVDAKIELIEYKIEYVNMENIDHNYPTTYTINDVIKLDVQTMPGYTFNGWYDEDGEGIYWVPVEKAKDMKIYASWDLNYYEVKYYTDPSSLHINEYNESDFNFSKLDKFYAVHDDDIVLPEIELTGYEFLGWYNYDTNEKISTIPASTLSDISVIAKFKPNEYSITLSTDVELVKDTYSINFGENFKLPSLDKDGYEFMGWQYDGKPITSYTGISYEPFGFINDITLESKFEIINYKINVSTNYDIELPEIPSSYTIDDDTIILPVLASDGYQFSGWKNIDTGNVITEISKGSFGDLNLMALITPKQYKVSFNSDGEVVHTIEVKYGSEFSSIINGLNKTGYSLAGWYIEDTKVLDENGSSLESFKYTNDIVVDAKWEIINYPIELSSNIEYDIKSLNIPSSHNVLSEEIILPQLSKDGYTFNGWKDKKSNNLIEKISANSIGSYELIATFTPNKYTINLSNEKTVDVIYNESYELPVIEKEGYTFVGWYKGDLKYADNTGKSIENYNDLTNITLTPKYEIKQYTIKYYHDDKLLETVSYDYDTIVTHYVPAKIEGQIFIGWYLNEDICNDGYVLKENIELYAKYEEGYEISTYEEFLNISKNPSSNYILKNDINFNGEIIGNICDFSGELIGNGYSLTGFIMNSKAVSGNYGIFKSNSGVIKNITLKDFTYNITIANSSSCAGILVGNNTGTIENVNIEGSISNITSNKTDSINALKYGCISGENSGSITNCNVSSTSTISLSYYTNPEFYDQGHKNYTKYYIGGITGYNKNVIESCNVLSTTTITSYIDIFSSGYKVPRPYNNNYIGGLVGMNTGENAIISKCYSDSTYKYSYSEKHHDRWYTYSVDNEVETLYLGGLVGCNDSKAILELSSATTEITGNTKWSNYIGGLVGANNNVAYIKSSYSDAAIKVNNSNHHAINVGGLIGYNSANILNCYSVGDVETNRNSYIGGFVGRNSSSGSIVKSYSTVNVIGQAGKAGKFAAHSEGVINKAYETQGSNLVLHNASEATLNQTSIITSMDYSDIINPKFLKETMTWNTEGWYIDGAIDPILLWEIETLHDFKEIKTFEATCESHGYTLSYCSHCDRVIMTDIVEATGHNHDESDKGITIKPTCDEQGYTKYTCITCKEEYREDYVESLGHEAITEIDCNNSNLYYKDGKFLYYCQSINQNNGTKCNCVIEIDTDMINHTDITNISYLAPACGSLNEESGEWEGEVIGHSSGRYCSSTSCAYKNAENENYIIKESVKLVSHEFEIEYTKKPTCIEAGLANYKCKLCSKVLEDVTIDVIDHTYESGSLQCTVCEQFEFDLSDYEPIYSYDDLISINLDGKYYLASDIDFANESFKPIGSASKPFTGHLIGFDKDGVSHTIKNITLMYTDKNDLCVGLFAKIGNNGVVANVTLENVSISVTNSNNAIIGGIAGSNAGTIYKCEVKGITSIHLESKVLADINTNITKDFKYTFGNIAGENIGIVNKCNINGKITMSYVLSSNVTGSFDVIETITSFGFATNNTSIISGGMTGLNKGILSNSVNEAEYTCDNRFESKVGGINKGQSYLFIDLYDGALVGINEKEVIECKSVVKNNNIHSSDEDFAEKSDVVEVIVVQRKEYMKVTDYTVFSENAGIIGYDSKNSSSDVETIN